MSLANRLNHSVRIERSATTPDGGDVERTEYGDPTEEYSTLATVNASIQPKSAREMAQLSQGGPVVGDFTIFLQPTDVKAADRLVDVDTSCSYAGTAFELTGIRDPAGVQHHLELDANRVLVGA